MSHLLEYTLSEKFLNWWTFSILLENHPNYFLDPRLFQTDTFVVEIIISGILFGLKGIVPWLSLSWVHCLPWFASFFETPSGVQEAKVYARNYEVKDRSNTI